MSLKTKIREGHQGSDVGAVYEPFCKFFLLHLNSLMKNNYPEEKFDHLVRQCTPIVEQSYCKVKKSIIDEGNWLRSEPRG